MKKKVGKYFFKGFVDPKVSPSPSNPKAKIRKIILVLYNIPIYLELLCIEHPQDAKEYYPFIQSLKTNDLNYKKINLNKNSLLPPFLSPYFTHLNTCW